MGDSNESLFHTHTQSMIKATNGAELCATNFQPSPNPVDCVRAYDATYEGRVDLSRKVIVGEPIRKSATTWSVPYNVKDEAGNEAVTVYRDVVVEEVGLQDMQSKMLADFAERETQLLQQIEDLKKRKGVTRSDSCPTCPKCDCSGHVNAASCRAFCPSIPADGSCPATPPVERIYAPREYYPLERQLFHPDGYPKWTGIIAIGLGLLILLWLFCTCQFQNNEPANTEFVNQFTMNGIGGERNVRFENGGGAAYDITSPPPGVNSASLYRTSTPASPNQQPQQRSLGAEMFQPTPSSIYRARHSISGSPTGEGVRTRERFS